MSERFRVLLLVSILSGTAAVALILSCSLLYRAALDAQRERLVELAQSQARLIEAVARFDARTSGGGDAAAGRDVTLGQIRDAHRHHQGFGRTGEFSLAERVGGEIVFLLSHRSNKLESPDPVSFDSELAAPMRQALLGRSGTLVGLDYRGERVLSAFEPVAELNLGIVAKIDLAEVRAPFIEAAAISGLCVLLAVAAGSMLFTRITNPIVEELRRSKERLDLAVRGSSDGLWDWNILTNEDYFSARFCELLGYGEFELPQQYSTFDTRLHPDDRARVLEAIRQHLELEVPYDLELRLRTKFGGYGWFRSRGEAVRDSQGRAVRMAGSISDISQRRENEERQARLIAAVEQATEAIVVTDSDGTIEYVNPAFETSTGYSKREAVGKKPSLLKSGRQNEEFYADLWQTIRRGQVWSGNFVNQRKDGGFYEEEATISPVRDPDGAIISFVSVKRDVTHERSLEMQLAQAQKLESIGQLASGIAHEINTPTQYVTDNIRFLTEAFASLSKVLSGYTILLEKNQAGTVPAGLVEKLEAERCEVDLEFLEREVPRAINESLEGLARVASIVGAMKEFSHPGSEDRMFVNLNHAIESTVAVARNEWKYVADVIMDLDPDLPEVPCYAAELNQAFLNLLVNAAQAIGEASSKEKNEKGTVTLRSRREGNWVEIRICDTGPGIPAEIRERIFDPFFTTKEVGRGTGQGLAITHSVVVEKHQGTIRFETKLGRGTEFIVRLPLEVA